MKHPGSGCERKRGGGHAWKTEEFPPLCRDEKHIKKLGELGCMGSRREPGGHEIPGAPTLGDEGEAFGSVRGHSIGGHQNRYWGPQKGRPGQRLGWDPACPSAGNECSVVGKQTQ